MPLFAPLKIYPVPTGYKRSGLNSNEMYADGLKVITSVVDTANGVVTDLTITSMLPDEPPSSIKGNLVNAQFIYSLYATGVGGTLHSFEYNIYATSGGGNEIDFYQKYITEPAGLVAASQWFSETFEMWCPYSLNNRITIRKIQPFGPINATLDSIRILGFKYNS